MGIQVKAGHLIASKEALEKIAKLPLSIKKAYKVSKIIRKIMTEWEDIEKRRGDIVMKHGEEVKEEANRYRIKPEEVGEYNAAINELFDIDVDIDVEKLSFDDVAVLADSSESAITPNEIMLLEPFMDFADIESKE